MRYARIARERDDFPLRLMCDVLEVSPSGFYAWKKRSPSERAIADDVLMAHIRISFEASGETYVAPRVHQDLKADGIHVGKKRVARVMKAEGLVGRGRKRGVRTTDSNHPHPIAPA